MTEMTESRRIDLQVLSFVNRWIAKRAGAAMQRERRRDPERLERTAIVRKRLADLLESLAAAVVASDLLAVIYLGVWWVWALGLILLATALLAEAAISRATANLQLERAAARRTEIIEDARHMFATASVHLTRQRIMTLRQRGAEPDVCSALASILRENGGQPCPGKPILNALDKILGRKRTDELLTPVRNALQV